MTMDTKQENGTSVPSGDAKPQPEAEWDEARLTSSLARLQELHIQLRQLRETIPSLMRVIHTEHSTPGGLYAEVSRAATDAVGDIKDFVQHMREPKSQEILRKAKDTKGKDGGAIMGWLVTQHPKWLEKSVHTTVEQVHVEAEDREEDKNAKLMAQDPAVVVEVFRKDHPDLDVLIDQEAQEIKFNLPQARLDFRIDLQSETNSKVPYKTTLRETIKLHGLILRAISQRPEPTNLQLLLEMLASYSDLRSRPCEKCNRPLDRDAQRPAYRVKRNDGWEALHAICASS